MSILFIAFLVALVGLVPLAISKNLKAWWLVIPEFLVVWYVLYMATPSTVYPLFGMPGGLAFALLGINGAFVMINDNFNTDIKAIMPFGLMLGAYLWVFGYNSEMYNAEKYRSLIGQMETRVWTQDIQPKDPKHYRMSTSANAIYMAKMAMGNADSIGSQFSISKGHMTQQMINGEMWFVVPLDFSGFFVWQSTDGIPGYIMVNGEDPNIPAVYKEFPQGQKMKFSPGAFFGSELERHLRNSGFTNYGLRDYTFEIDDTGKAWWVVTAYEPTIGFHGQKVTGVIIVDPATGESKLFPVGEVPEWVDRVVPDGIVEQNLSYWGELIGGYLNSFYGKKGLMQPEEANLIYGSDGQPEWVTGLTSMSDKDDSLVGVVYTNSRTGKSVWYEVKGGATDEAILKAVGMHVDVQYRKLHGVSPQLYNILGTMASVVPLLNGNDAFAGVAIVNVTNPQKIAVGDNVYEAMRKYENLMANSGQHTGIEKSRNLKTVTGVVDRCGMDISSTGVSYYIHLANLSHVFSGSTSKLSVKLALTKVGDTVKIEYFASEQGILPMHDFDNQSFQIKASAEEKDIAGRTAVRNEEAETRQDAQTALEKIKKLSPAEIKALGQQVK